MKGEVPHTVWCNISDKVAGEMWNWSLLGVKGLSLMCPPPGLTAGLFFTAKSVSDQSAELVCTKPFPSMPIYFWNDEHGVKYKKAYFAKFPGQYNPL